MSSIIKQGAKLRRLLSLKRADYRCELCRKVIGQSRLDDHHLLPKSVYPQHRFELQNSAILCKMECHPLAENDPEEFERRAIKFEKLRPRIIWARSNRGINKYPVEVDHDEAVSKLLKAI